MSCHIFFVGRYNPGQQMSAPKIADITIHISTAAVNSQGAAPRLIELNRRKC